MALEKIETYLSRIADALETIALKQKSEAPRVTTNTPISTNIPAPTRISVVETSDLPAPKMKKTANNIVVSPKEKPVQKMKKTVKKKAASPKAKPVQKPQSPPTVEAIEEKNTDNLVLNTTKNTEPAPIQKDTSLFTTDDLISVAKEIILGNPYEKKGENAVKAILKSFNATRMSQIKNEDIKSVYDEMSKVLTEGVE